MSEAIPHQPLVLFHREGEIAVLTLNNPTRRNALSLRMREVLYEHLLEVEHDEQVRAIVLTGAGGQFCAGGDLSEMHQRPVLEARLRMDLPTRIFKLLVTGPKPFLVAAEGNVAGVGLSLLAASDYAVAASDARLSCAFIKVGLLPDAGGLWSIPRRVGRRKALELCALGEPFDAESALSMGMVNAVSPPGQALAQALVVARKMAQNPPVAMALLRAALSVGADTLDQAVNTEITMQGALMNTDDFGEAASAFMDKRPPVFRGR
jgi:enoyl-CoA hydratase/carnithine racemase